VVVDEDKDPYNWVREWWNQDGLSYASPRLHLFEKLGLEGTATGLKPVGKGLVLRLDRSPAALTRQKTGADEVVDATHKAAGFVKLSWKESSALVMRRGKYIVAAGIDSAESSTQPVVLHGDFIDLFDAELSELSNVSLHPGSRMLLLDLQALDQRKPQILAASGRISAEEASVNQLSFNFSGIEDTEGIARIFTLRPPKRVSINSTSIDSSALNYNGRMLLIHLLISARPSKVTIEF
jgi:hypothetical protein